MPFPRPCQIVDKSLHPIKAGIVKGLQNIEGSKEKRTGTAGGIEHGDRWNGLIKCPQEFRAFAFRDRILCKLAYVEIVSDQIVDLTNFALCEFVDDVKAPLPPGHMLPPGFRGKGIIGIGRLVPSFAFCHIVDAFCNLSGQRNYIPVFIDDTFGHCRIDVTKWGVFQQPPERRIRLEGDSTFFPGCIEQVGEDRVFWYVLGNILFSVICPHLFLVDIFFKNIAEHVRVDFFVIAQRPVVQMPFVLVEKGEQLFKGLIRYIYFGIFPLQFMQFEQAAVKIRHLSQQIFQVLFSLLRLLCKSLMKKPKKKIAIKWEKFPFAFAFPDHFQAVFKIIGIFIQKTFPLDKIDEHEAIEHQRGIPFSVPLLRNSLNKSEEGTVLCFEMIVESFGDCISIKSVT